MPLETAWLGASWAEWAGECDPHPFMNTPGIPKLCFTE
jgi:hypothetical protein